ncbi:sulfatase-like hydrolase/transferase [Rhizobium helianthi]|uniref:Sulfatase-like hydrolase/transferase n=1 Tax=Rhizobium helianthi TaxID=1132695 RepID=A0ABW4M1V4_9HYPH
MVKSFDYNRSFRPQARITLFVILLWLLLDLPAHPDAITPEAFLRLPLELPIIVLLLTLTTGAIRRGFTLLLTASAGLILLLKLADIGTQAAFQRPFNPYLDGKMIPDGWNVLSGSIGTVSASLLIAGVMIILCAIMWLFFYSAGFATKMQQQLRNRLVAANVATAVCTALSLFAQNHFGWEHPWRVEATAIPSLVERGRLVVHSMKDMRRFEAELASDDPASSRKDLFKAIQGQDVFIIFIESLGRSAVQDPRYAPLIQPRFSRLQEELQSAGFHAASTWLRSPTVGGLSWLAHGTLLSGLWVDSQARYDRLIRSDRASLNRLFRDAGWMTFAAMPAITMDWPESRYFGYDAIFAAKDLGYQGKPFNWVTMPDQFTLSAIERLIRAPAPRPPAMIETALISSHAPWTPVARMVDWSQIGDGTIFDDQAAAGEPPAELWKDPEKVRDHYIRTIDYSLEAVGAYIQKYGKNSLFIVVGDHQPAAIITGPNASRDVPLFILSQKANVIAGFQQSGFEPGLVSNREGSIPMDRFRNLMVEILSRPKTASELPSPQTDG